MLPVRHTEPNIRTITEGRLSSAANKTSLSELMDAPKTKRERDGQKNNKADETSQNCVTTSPTCLTEMLLSTGDLH